MFYVYVLQSLKDKKFYIGFTTQQPNERLKGHNNGNTESTKKRRPLKLLYYEAHTSEKDARCREKYFKSTRGKTTLRTMLKEYLAG